MHPILSPTFAVCHVCCLLRGCSLPLCSTVASQGLFPVSLLPHHSSYWSLPKLWWCSYMHQRVGVLLFDGSTMLIWFFSAPHKDKIQNPASLERSQLQAFQPVRCSWISVWERTNLGTGHQHSCCTQGPAASGEVGRAALPRTDSEMKARLSQTEHMKLSQDVIVIAAIILLITSDHIWSHLITSDH